MNEVRLAFKAKPIPVPGAKVDLVYHPAILKDSESTPQFWTVRLYRNNLRQFNGDDQTAIVSWAWETIARCRDLDDHVYVEVLEREE